jgi:peptide/nickel transport system permease protein
MTDPRDGASTTAPPARREAVFLGIRYRPAEHQILHAFARDRLVIAAALLLLLLVACALCADWITPVPATKQHVAARLTPPVWTTGGHLPYLLGTDRLGRDIYSVIVHGLRISLLVGVLSAMLSMLAGVFLGLLAGYKRGACETLIMRAVDIQLSLPTIMVALCFIVMFGKGLLNMILVIAITGWATYARTVRGTVLSIREKEYVESARALGVGPLTMMLKYFLINAVSPIVVLAAVDIPRVILLESTLSFLGVGVPVTTPSLGLAIARGYEVLFSGKWWVSVFPGLMLMVLVGCINIFGDWLRDTLEPRARKRF